MPWPNEPPEPPKEPEAPRVRLTRALRRIAIFSIVLWLLWFGVFGWFLVEASLKQNCTPAQLFNSLLSMVLGWPAGIFGIAVLVLLGSWYVGRNGASS